MRLRVRMISHGANQDKRHRVKRLGILITGLVLSGCPEQRPVADAAVAMDAGGEIDAGLFDAGPPIPTELTFLIDFLGMDGGVTSVQSNAGVAHVDPTRTVFIQFPAPLKDYRVRMFDGAEQVLPSDEEARAED